MLNKILVVKPLTKEMAANKEKVVNLVDAESDLYLQFKNIIGGYLENVYAPLLPKPYQMVCDEEGLIKGLDINLPASLIYNSNSPVVGNVVICKMVMGEEGPEWAGLDEKEMSKLLDFIGKVLTAAMLESILKGGK